MELNVTKAQIGALKNYRFVVICARYQGKWILCRHKERTSYELPGGHIEPGETPRQAAERELFEETGALSFEMKAAFDYCVSRGEEASCGQVFLARVQKLGPLPDSEMAQIALMDDLPLDMTYPAIQPLLYRWMQQWLNLMSAPDEVWDIYDENRKLTGQTHRRGNPLAPGAYHLSVEVWIRNTKGELLITRRDEKKGYPLRWEATGGAAQVGDDSMTAALREVKEETGLILDPKRGRLLNARREQDTFVDTWCFDQDVNLCDVILQPGETCDVRWIDEEGLLALQKERKFLPMEGLAMLLKQMHQSTPERKD